MIIKVKIKKNILIAIAFILIFCILIYITDKKNSKTLDSDTNGSKQSITLVIDAGHGGMDGGAVARDGTEEKGINLSIATKLNLLLKSMGFATVMTRTGDYSIHDSSAKNIRQKKVSDIRNRLKIIEETPNSIFISIHQNHFSVEKYHGTQVFYSKNNAESEILAENIQASAKKLLQPDNERKIKKSGTDIYLLYETKSPAVMVECGFLSNWAETKKLKSEEYQQKMAFSIMCGILEYIGNKNTIS